MILSQPSKTTAILKGKIVASHGSHHLLDITDGKGQSVQCFSKGKKDKIVVGDEVEYQLASKNQAIIVNVKTRFNQFERSTPIKTKILASNIDQVIILVATEPQINEELLNRILIEAEYKAIPAIIILNKIDIYSKLALARKCLAKLKNLGHLIIEASIQDSEKNCNIVEIKPLLLQLFTKRRSLLVGQSGVGKSTLINLFIPEAKAKTQSISTSLGTGKHTTSLTKLFKLANTGELIDSPGFQEFGLNHIRKRKLAFAFREFRPQLGLCRFHNCQHKEEPGCAVIKCVSNGGIHLTRYSLYRKILTEGQ